MHRPSRRSFLQMSGSVAVAAPLLGSLGSAAARPRAFDPNFGSATEALAAMRERVISSRELTAHVFARIRQYNPRVNAFVTLLEAQALEQAARADELRARRGQLGPLHGLPILIKDSIETAGVRTTSGAPQYANFVPTADAPAVARLKRAGALLIGKTNLPPLAGDWQTSNTIAGRTNNPWDLTRTPGGSTGGGAAALAAGLGFLELGSDIAGSVRIPSSFCGVYGHKPSHDLIPFRGHIPPAPGTLSSNVLSDLGPLARSAEDLLLELSITAGPVEEIAYRWAPPKPRRNALRDYRIGYVLDDPFCPVDPPVRAVLEQAVHALRRAGVQLVEGFPREALPVPITAQEMFELYFFLLGTVYAPGFSAEEIATFQEAIRRGVAQGYAYGAVASHAEWYSRNEARLRLRASWQSYFREFDAFLLPNCFVTAFPHDSSTLPPRERTVATSQGPRPYNDLMKWASFAVVTGLPATSAPVGRTAEGLPVGIQIMGPYHEDLTTLDIAQRMSELLGGFKPPPGYSA